MVINLAKIKKTLSQFFMGHGLFKSLPVGNEDIRNQKSIKEIIQKKQNFISKKEKSVLFFEMAKTNNTLVLKMDDNLLNQISLL